MLPNLIKTNPQYFYLFAVAMSFIIVVAIMGSIISFSVKYKLFDKQDFHRKNHNENISRLGGVAIFIGFAITVLLFTPWIHYENGNFLIVACFILGAMGLKDDVYGTSLTAKLILQISVALLLVLFGGYHLTSLYGVFGIEEMNCFWGGLFSVVLIIFLSNTFNLIDGIDGLAASTGLTVTASFGILFAMMNEPPYAFISFSLFGALLAFLKYNWYPAKIFMGDTGSLLIGLITSILAIKFIELNKVSSPGNPMYFSAPAIAVSILIIPIFDTLRIFVIRLSQRKTPFHGDRNHMHHRLQQLGMRADQIVVMTVALNAIFVALVFTMQNLGNFVLICLMIVACIIFNLGVTVALKRKCKEAF